MITKLTDKLDDFYKDGKIRGRVCLSDGNIVYSFPKSNTEPIVKILDVYSSKDLITDSESMVDVNHRNSLRDFINLLNDVSGNDSILSSKMSDCIDMCICKPTSRISYKFNGSKSQLSITVNRILYIAMHESAADLSMLSDFEEIKESFDLVSRAFVTLGKPSVVIFNDNTQSRSRVCYRDTILIAPQGAKKLADVGAIYGEDYHKIDIGDYRDGKMSTLLSKDRDLFIRYGQRDAEITLKHASTMEEFYFDLGKIGVPLTISGISKAYVLNEWSAMGYDGYQIDNDIMVGNLTSKLTPKAARSIGLSKYIVPYVAGYRGGRNESMMYGVDDGLSSKKREYYDYDLTSAYTTIMSILGHPDYDNAVRLYNKTVVTMTKDIRNFLFNYIILDVKFEFPEGTKYPCIPTRVDEDVDIYPLKGNSIITGLEYLVALSMGCKIVVNEGVMIPFKGFNNKKKSTDLTYQAPFRNIIKELQSKRRKYPKKTFYNYMYKEIGNSIYGLVAMGVSGRTSYDAKTKTNMRIEGGLLSNPILASYITGYARAFVGECLNNIQLLGGSVVSVTTDG